MKKMTIDELIEKKKELEEKIGNEVSSFQEEMGLVLDSDIIISHVWGVGRTIPIVTKVKVKLALPGLT